MNTKGKPKAAMWEGLLPVSIPPEASTPGGWRQVVADGNTMLEGEAFIAMNRFSVTPGSEAAFEKRFAARQSTLTSFEGFKGFTLLRRDGSDPDGFTHSTWSVWQDRAAFEKWRNSEQRAGKPSPPASTTSSESSGPPTSSMFTRKPVP